MSPVERKKIEDTAKEAGIQGDEIPNIVELEMRLNVAIDDTSGDISEILVIV